MRLPSVFNRKSTIQNPSSPTKNWLYGRLKFSIPFLAFTKASGGKLISNFSQIPINRPIPPSLTPEVFVRIEYCIEPPTLVYQNPSASNSDFWTSASADDWIWVVIDFKFKTKAEFSKYIREKGFENVTALDKAFDSKTKKIIIQD